MHIFWCRGSKFSVKFQRTALKFHTAFWTHKLHNMYFTDFHFCGWLQYFVLWRQKLMWGRPQKYNTLKSIDISMFHTTWQQVSRNWRTQLRLTSFLRIRSKPIVSWAKETNLGSTLVLIGMYMLFLWRINFWQNHCQVRWFGVVMWVI